MIVAIVRDPGQTLGAKIRGAFTPKKNWGPSDPLLREQYHKEIENELTPKRGQGIWAAIKQNIFGWSIISENKLTTIAHVNNLILREKNLKDLV